MNRFTRFLTPALDKAGDWLGATGDGPQLSHNVCLVLEQIAVGIVLSAFLGMFGRFVPFWATAGVLAVGAGAAWGLGSRFRIGSLTFLGLSTFYFFLTQPTMVLGLATVVGLGAAGIAGWKVSGIWLRLVAIIGALAAGFGATVGLYWLMYNLILPAVHPLTVWAWNISPVLSLIPTLGVIGYCSYRQPATQTSWYWLATPALGVLFCATFWPSHSYLGMSIGVLTAAGLSVFSFLQRPTVDRVYKSHLAFGAAAVAAMLFTGAFWLSNSWTWLYRYSMANAVTVTHADKVPVTNNKRMVPFMAAQDYCAQQNTETNTGLITPPSPIVIPDENGENRFYWQCIRHPTGFAGHWGSWLTGGAEGVILADAGDKGRFGKVLDVEFIFGDTSNFTKGAFYARHPGAEMQPGMVGRMKDGQLRILIPYVSKVLQWGAMVPELSGVMAVTPWGLIEDYTPSQAADAFPGVRFVPSDLARQYADLWAQESSLYDKHVTANVWEVSEFAGAGDNRYPFWQDFKVEGLMGVIPFEPRGKDQKALMAIGLFDRATLSMTVIDMSKSGLPGPRQVANVALSHPGLFNVKAAEALLVVPESRNIYWLTALMQPDKELFHGYSMNVLYDGHAQNHWDIESSAALDAALAKVEKTAEPVATPTPNK